MEPILLPSNQPAARFYRGGERISRFRGEPPAPPHTPEDWVGSTTSVRGSTPTGLTRLANGELLADVIARDPEAWLGTPHVRRYGPDTMLLVKLLDAGQRLPVHAHPDGDFARRHASAAHGKAEAWYILSPGTVHLGLVHDVSVEQLRTLVTTQDSQALLSLMHEVPVAAGDSVFVPHGVLHAIGEGILLTEVQEPEDLSILLEWSGFDLDGERDGHLGVGFDLALTAIERRARTREEVGALVRRGVAQGSVLAEDSEPFFRLDRVAGRQDFAAGFAIVVGLATTRLTIQSGLSLTVDAGATALIPFGAGTFRIDGTALVARPPRP